MKEKIVKVVPPLLVFIFLLVGTFIAWRFTQDVVRTEVKQRFNHEIQIAKHWMQDRLNLYLPMALGIRIFFETGDGITANEWSTYIQRLKLIDKYPAISSINYIERVREENRDIFVSQLQSDKSLPPNYSSFDIHPRDEKSEYYVVKYVEPFNGHEETVGFDLSSDQKQLELLNSVRDEDPTSTGRVTLITTPGEGFEITLPVYRSGSPPVTIEDRRQALKGFVQVKFAGDKLFQDIFDAVNLINLNFEVFSGLPGKENLLYTQAQPLSTSNQDYRSGMKLSETFEFNNQTWYLVAQDTQDFKLTPSQERLPLIVLGSGLVFSFLFLGIYLYMLKHNNFKSYKDN